jgi:hypothetical protein
MIGKDGAELQGVVNAAGTIGRHRRPVNGPE